MSKKLLPSLLSLTLIHSTYAAVLVSDDFSTDGNLNASSPDTGGAWATHSGTAGQVQSSGGSLLVSQSGATEDVNTGFLTTVASGDLFYSFDFSVTAGGSFSSNIQYFAHFKPTGTTGFISQLSVIAPSSSGFSLAISNTSSAETALGYDLDFGVTYKAVVRYSFNDGFSTLWVDPSALSDSSVSSTTSNTSVAPVSFAFRQGDSGANEQITIDSLRVTTTFAEVIPEPNSTLLLALGTSSILLRRKRTFI